MKKEFIDTGGITTELISCNTLVIGSGAAALNAAFQLASLGVSDVAVATGDIGGGTSMNAGSDKQTYYKLSLAGPEADSPLLMAGDLFRGGCVHGDIALCEANCSVVAFMNLVRLGVPFPHDTYGSFPGYRTDHDTRGRASSAGPLTSRYMTTALLQAVKEKGIPVINKCFVNILITGKESGDDRVYGAIALQTGTNPSVILFNAVNVIVATGGPASMYGHSVYPLSQYGSHGMLFRAGATAQNLTESQSGIASVKFRWNLSGSYQQALPRYFSTRQDGSGEHEFLSDFFPDVSTLATAIFLKGYQWPFDPLKAVQYGSSLIDLLVYRETVMLGRRVWVDYMNNPCTTGRLSGFSLSNLSPEAHGYLQTANALQPNPFERLRVLNEPAIELFRSHGIDLASEPLEIRVAAQHNNGGFTGDIWWESNIAHLFPVGEVNGSHGIRRPGGSALNAGQTGGYRTALRISRNYTGSPLPPRAFTETAKPFLKEFNGTINRLLEPPGPGSIDCINGWKQLHERMDRHGGIVRDAGHSEKAAGEAWQFLEKLRQKLFIKTPDGLPDALRLLDASLSAAMYLESIDIYIRTGGNSRGSSLVIRQEGESLLPLPEDVWRTKIEPPDSKMKNQILEIRYLSGRTTEHRWVPVRPIPEQDLWFEKVWKEFRKT